MHPELRLGRHAIIEDLIGLEALPKRLADRLGEGQAIRPGIEDRLAIDRGVSIEGIHMQADEHASTRGLRDGPALRDLDILVGGSRHHDLDPFFLEEGAQPESEVERDVFFHDATDDDARIPELGRVAGGAATMPRVDRHDVGSGHDEGRL